MTNLLWPGDERAGEYMTDQTLLRAMVAVESAWLNALAGAGLAPIGVADLDQLIDADDCEQLAASAEDGGNPVLALVTLLRHRAVPAVSPWIHRGLTSQDVLDTALMLAIKDVVGRLTGQLAEQISTLSALAATHRTTTMLARTLTQHAAPTTFGVKAARWLDGVVDAHDRLRAVATPAQFGGAVGTLSATVELAPSGSAAAAARSAEEVSRSAATILGLGHRSPWHTTRTPVTAIGDAMVGCTDSWGRIASDIVTLVRPEIAEVSEPATEQRGRSSSMPHKRNPVLSILIRRAALAAPPLTATLHTAAALANDERPDGSWHAEWDTLRTLARRTVVAGSQCVELLAGLQVHTVAMAENLRSANVTGGQGAADRLIDQSIERARQALHYCGP